LKKCFYILYYTFTFNISFYIFKIFPTFVLKNLKVIGGSDQKN